MAYFSSILLQLDGKLPSRIFFSGLLSCPNVTLGARFRPWSGATDSAELRCGRVQREERGDVGKVASGRAAVGAIPGLQEGCEVVEQLGHLCFDERSADHHSGATCFGCKERVELGELG